MNIHEKMAYIFFPHNPFCIFNETKLISGICWQILYRFWLKINIDLLLPLKTSELIDKMGMSANKAICEAVQSLGKTLQALLSWQSLGEPTVRCNASNLAAHPIPEQQGSGDKGAPIYTAVTRKCSLLVSRCYQSQMTIYGSSQKLKQHQQSLNRWH
ncbi:hypothetical protein [Undibacterium sp. TJN19]|uniref:hypothetical protein n=1 Tax=Undibacterium sp. TJN19 TaxID=3413055 RepID=UPI003BF376AD